MSDIDKKLNDTLLHYGVKGMKWRERKSEQLSISEDEAAGGKSPEQKLDEIGAKLDDIKGKVGDGPLDMLRYIVTGKTKKVNKSKGSSDLDVLGQKIKDVRSKIGNGPLDMIKYILTGKKKIQHSGVKGMRWGVRRDYNRPGGADGKKDAKDKPIRTSLGKKWNSLKRERQWSSILKEMDNLSTKDITEVARRVSLENSLKTLSRSKFATKKDKEDYLRREHMDNQELSRKVTRLRAKESLHNAVRSASKEQREFGQKVVNIGSSLGIRYALNKGNLGLDDVIGAVSNPKGSSDKAKQDAKTELTKRAKELLKKANG
jgi:hypothetical protein